MAYAILLRDIIAHEQDDESATKHFPSGTLLDVEDWDDDWFLFSSNDDPHTLYDVSEPTSKALKFDDDEYNEDESFEAHTKGSAPYKPVPNMTPQNRKLLL